MKYQPGDHKGCQCSYEKLFVRSSGKTVDRVTVTQLGESSETLVERGSRLIAAANRRGEGERMELALDYLDALMADEPELRARYAELLEKVDKYGTTETQKSPYGDEEYGFFNFHFTSAAERREGKITPESTELSIEMNRIRTEWTDWMLSGQAGPEPVQYREATAQEIAETMAHELAHAHRHFARREDKVKVTDMFEEAGGVQAFRMAGQSDPELYEYFMYGMDSPEEAMADSVRFYFTGIQTASRYVTPEEFRRRFPGVARAVRQSVLRSLELVAA